MKKIIITGGNGFIASLVKEALQNEYEVISMTRKDADFSNPLAVTAYFEQQTFNYVFHTAAMAQTADCENYPELTYKVNVESTKAIADQCRKKNARLIFISTEQCFNGKTSEGPFKEEDTLCSITKYGQHKIECETYITTHLDDYLILRFSWMFGMDRPGCKASPNIVRNVMNALFYQQPTKFTVNEIRGMTYAQKLADQFAAILQLSSGIYHISDTNTHNTYEAAKIIGQKLGFDETAIHTYLLPDTERYKDRFRDYRLDHQKIENAGIHFGTFEENIEECLNAFGWLKQSS